MLCPWYFAIKGKLYFHLVSLELMGKLNNW